MWKEELRNYLEYLSQIMKFVVLDLGKYCSPQDCLNLNSISPHPLPPGSKRPLEIYFFSSCSPCHNSPMSRKVQWVCLWGRLEQACHSLITKEGRFQVTVNTHGSGKIWDGIVTPSCLQEKGRAALCSRWSLNSWASERSEEITGVRQEAFQRWWKAERDTHPFKSQGRMLFQGWHKYLPPKKRRKAVD